MQTFYMTDAGKVRTHNEDNVIILNNNNTNYFLSTGISKDSNLVYVMQDDYKVYTKVSTTTLKIVPTIALDKSLLTKGDGTIESPYEVE